MTKPSGSHSSITPAQDRPFLAEADRLTLDAISTHPLPYAGWHRAVALFGTLGSVEPRANEDYAFRIGDEHHLVRKHRWPAEGCHVDGSRRAAVPAGVQPRGQGRRPR